MRKHEAKKLANYHNFTKVELYKILRKALEQKPVNFWSKPNASNNIFDNGAYFNLCVQWLGFNPDGENTAPSKLTVIRILHIFGEFSAVQLPEKIKPKAQVQCSEYPSLKRKNK